MEMSGFNKGMKVVTTQEICRYDLDITETLSLTLKH